ncbi:MAG: TraB/GumN family protein [Haliscomenobacter sp.]|nr:TraB/GumN family protein [Haliscomenobacter sp.]
MYKNQDIEGMQGMLGADKEIAAFENLLLVNRNRKWIPIMEKMMSEKPTFFAVGAGHLGGPQGVVQLLRDSGYSLTPLK